MADVPSEIAATETLARDMSSKDAKERAERGKSSLFREFLPGHGDCRVSVDRMTHAGPDRARELAERRAATGGRTFFGWSLVGAEDASLKGRTVIASPTTEPDNPYHADIVLPTADRDEQKQHAQDLAVRSVWQPAN